MVRQQSVVGYSPEVTLGELGRVVEDPSEVLRVQFTDYHTNAPARVLGPIYLHGAILTNYHAGRWQSGTVIPSVGFEPLDRYRYTFPPDLVRQRITIEPLRQRELFCVMPFVPLKTDYNISIDYRRKRLLRESHLCGRRFTYQLGTTAIVDGRQRPLTPGEGGVPRDAHLGMPEGEGTETLPRLRELAARWIAESDLPADRVYARARYLESKLARSGLFSYSLQGQNRDSSLDPIDDFLTNNRRGHCEYFATALTLMLRSQGIPARMVLGYKTDEYDRTGGFFQVRQLHAHTWVEAFLEYEQVPPELLHGQSMWGWRNGGWLQLEPTPALRDRMADLDGLHWSPLARAQLWLNTRWSDYVLDMDRSRQQEAIYMPIVRAVQAAWQRLTDPAWWRQAMAAWRELAQWPRWQAGLAVSLVLLVLLVIGLLGYRLARWLAPRLAPLVRRRRAGATQSVEFYARLERLLARRGLCRPAGQTPREFAMAAAGQLDRDLAEAPERVVAAFYQVRFGRRPLDKHQAEAVEQALGRIDTAE